MAASRATPAWMSALIVLLCFAMLTAIGFYLHHYSRFAALQQEWHNANEMRKEVEKAKQPIEKDIADLADLIATHRTEADKVTTNLNDEKRAIRSLHDEQALRIQSMRASIEKIEHVMGGENAMFEVVAVTSDGKRYIVKQSGDAPLLGDAEHIAAVVGKPILKVKNVRGFND